jgi:monovalent cation/proton antiporter MnhG/PhaG subunit
MLDVVLIITLLLGTLLICVSNIAIFIFKDVYVESHVLTKAGTLGITLLLISVYIRLPLSQLQSLELLICLALQWLTIPLSGQYINYLEFLRTTKSK